MARRAPAVPTRVVAIAGVLLVGLLGLLWLVSGLGTPTGPITEGPVVEGPVTENPEVTDPAAAVPPTPDATQAAPGTEDGTATVPAPDLASEPVPAAATGLPVTESVTVQLFLVDPQARRLVSRVRRIEAPMTLPAQAQMALDLLARVNDAGLISPLPQGTRVREVWVSPGGIAYVDFPAGFPRTLPQGSLGEIQAVYGVVATLTASFPNIRSVQFLVNGEPVDTLTGHLDLSAPMTPLADWVY